MSVADRLDQLRAEAWLLARRTRRSGRKWQSQVQQITDDLPEQAEEARDRMRRQARIMSSRARNMARNLDRRLPAAADIAPLAPWLAALQAGWGRAESELRPLGRQAAARIEALGEQAGDLAERLQPRASATMQALAERGEAWQKSANRWWHRRDAEAIVSQAMAGGALRDMLPTWARRSRVHPVAWWLGFGLALSLTALWIRNRRITASLRQVTPPPEMDVQRHPTAFGDLAYRVVGSGPPLVLIHGVAPGGSQMDFADNIESLSRVFQVYAIDLLGCGLSDKPAITYTGERMAEVLQSFLRDVVGKPAHVVASGLSAAFTARAVAQHPELAANLVLVNPVGEAGPALSRAMGALLGSVPFVERSLYYALTGRARLARDLRSHLVDPGSADDSRIEHLFANARQPGADRIIRDMAAGRMDLDLAAELAKLQVPLTILWGRHTTWPTQAKTRHLVELLPEACLCVFENSGQYPQADEPEGFNQFLVDRFATPVKATSR
jgi:pimeloyl-ACP methyl ester carboxylesterase